MLVPCTTSHFTRGLSRHISPHCLAHSIPNTPLLTHPNTESSDSRAVQEHLESVRKIAHHSPTPFRIVGTTTSSHALCSSIFTQTHIRQQRQHHRSPALRHQNLRLGHQHRMRPLRMASGLSEGLEGGERDAGVLVARAAGDDLHDGLGEPILEHGLG